jgi:transcriptional regulator with XRE-family HTH domain
MSVIEDSIALRVGRAVKARRDTLGLSLRTLAERSNVSASMISDIERGAKSPTISTLALLAGALGVTLSALADSEQAAAKRVHVTRRGDQEIDVSPLDGVKRENFGLVSPGRIELVRYMVPPQTTLGPFAPHTRGTSEHLYVAAGTIRIICGDEAERLEAGDSCSCIVDVPHIFDNADGNVEALVYLIVEPGRG